MLVTLATAKDQLNLDHDDYDLKVERLIRQASEIVIDYLKMPAGSYENSSGVPLLVPAVVEAAVLLALTALYENPDGSADGPQPLSDAVKSLLHRLRDPALA